MSFLSNKWSVLYFFLAIIPLILLLHYLSVVPKEKFISDLGKFSINYPSSLKIVRLSDGIIFKSRSGHTISMTYQLVDGGSFEKMVEYNYVKDKIPDEGIEYFENGAKFIITRDDSSKVKNIFHIQNGKMFHFFTQSEDQFELIEEIAQSLVVNN